MESRFEYRAPADAYGPAVSYTRTDEQGRMFIGNGEYETQVNYCPFTGVAAIVKMEVEHHKTFKKYVNKGEEVAY